MPGKRFHFSLSSVLKLRMHETESARQNLAGILRQREQQEEKAEHARRKLDDIVRSRVTGATGQRELSRHEAFRNQAQQQLDEANRMLENLRAREREARLGLIERKAAEEALKQLREDEEAKFWKEQRSAETKFLDEQAISSYQRQRRAANS